MLIPKPNVEILIKPGLSQHESSLTCPSEPLDLAAAVSNHPVLLHKLTLMRQEGVPPREFRRLLKEVTYYVG